MRHNINPIIADLGPLQIRWYGFLYLLSFVLSYFILRRNFKYRNIKLNKDDYENLLFNLCLGVVIGGRLGYIIFYNLPFYLHTPLKLLAVWEGGMSFHGGAIVVLYIGWRFCRKHGYNFFQMADVTAPIACIGLGLGRLGNFINGELYGKVTDLPWGIIFPGGGESPRHPSQLYEMILEGIVLFLITQTLLRKTTREGMVIFVWLICYGIFRTLVEFIRIPDEQIGYILNLVTMGQILSFAMIIAGLAGIFFYHPRKHEIKN